MPKRDSARQPRKPYSAPRIVDFGTMEAMTGDCFGPCPDGTHAGQDW